MRWKETPLSSAPASRAAMRQGSGLAGLHAGVTPPSSLSGSPLLLSGSGVCACSRDCLLFRPFVEHGAKNRSDFSLIQLLSS